MLKKIKLLLATMVVFSLFAFMGVTAFAADTTAYIELSAYDDDGTTGVAGLTPTIYDAAGNALTTGSWTNASGKYTFKDITTKGAYDVKLTSVSGVSVTVSVNVTGFSASTAKTAKVTWVNATTLDPKKSGVLGGLVTDGTNALSGIKVAAYNAKEKWETVTNSLGAYRLWLPQGSYTLVIYAQNSTTYKNLFTDVKVTAGQMSGPMDDQNAKTAWLTNENQLGYSVAYAPYVKAITGSAIVNSTVYAYSYDGAKYALLAKSSKVTPSTAGAKTGKFTIALPNYTPDSNIVFRVVDKALNEYQDDTYKTTKTPKMTMTMTAMTDSTKATVGLPISITFKDSNKLDAFLLSKITAVTVKDASNATVALTLKNKAGTVVTAIKDSYPANSDFAVAGGKITFKAGVLGTKQTYTITMVATGYTDGSVTQAITDSGTAAPTIPGTFTAAAGSVVSSTKLTSTGSAIVATGDTFKYVIAKSTDVAGKLYNVVTSGAVALTTGADIVGIDATTNKNIDVYQVDSTNRIKAYKRVPIAATAIKAPVISTATVSGSAITLTADTNLKTTAPTVTTSLFTVVVGGRTVGVSNVSIATNKVTITLAEAVVNAQKVTIKYTAPGTNPLQDTYGNKIASITTARDVTNSTAAAAAATISGAAIKAGTATSSSAITFTAVTGHKFITVVTATTTATPNAGITPPSTTYYTSGANITGVDATKFISLYEVDADNKTVKFLEFDVAAGQFKP